MTETIDSEQCADLLHCTPEQVEELARTGEIPGLKIGRHWLFVTRDLLAYLAEKARQEAEQRRSRRQPGVTAMVKPRRRVPPRLPV
jgi:excisionase family DNA binding protein